MRGKTAMCLCAALMAPNHLTVLSWVEPFIQTGHSATKKLFLLSNIMQSPVISIPSLLGSQWRMDAGNCDHFYSNTIAALHCTGTLRETNSSQPSYLSGPQHTLNHNTVPDQYSAPRTQYRVQTAHNHPTTAWPLVEHFTKLISKPNTATSSHYQDGEIVEDERRQTKQTTKTPRNQDGQFLWFIISVCYWFFYPEI